MPVLRPGLVQIVKASLGIYTLNQAGTGPAVIQNFNSQADQPVKHIVAGGAPRAILRREAIEAGRPSPPALLRARKIFGMPALGTCVSYPMQSGSEPFPVQSSGKTMDAGPLLTVSCGYFFHYCLGALHTRAL